MSNQAPDMSATLFQVYGTNKLASAEDHQRQAEAELFLGLCKSAGIDPKHLTDDQVNELWKAASAESKAEEKKEDKKKEEAEKKAAAATQEWQEKRAMAEKVAEADALGRIMAHSYVDELQKIAAANKVAEFPPQFMKGKKDDKGEEKMEGGKPEGKKDEKEEDEKKKESQDRANALIAKLAGIKSGSSSTPNLDEQAAAHAVEMLKAAGHDVKVASDRIGAVATLGLQESAKIASAASAEQALTVRALEFCEAAGYQVDWSKA